MIAGSIHRFALQSPDPDGLGGFLQALGFRSLGTGSLALENERIDIAEAEPGGVDPHAIPSNDTRFQHLALIVSDMAAAYARLRTLSGWSAISLAGPERLPPEFGRVAAFKFRDPDGHPLELLQFPAGERPKVWQDREGLFLGIDHSAISVRDTEASLAFYGTIGFTVLSRQIHRGAEQARLDGLAAADVAVEVTGLKPPGGAGTPHLELLCYRSPPATVHSPVGERQAAATRVMMVGLPSGEGPGGGLSDPDGHRLADVRLPSA